MGRMFKNTVKRILGESLSTKLKYVLSRNKQKRLDAVPFNLDDLVFVLKDVCKAKKGDMLFVHSSIGRLVIDVNAYKVIEVLMDFVGSEGAILMPSYPRLPSYDFLKSGDIWDARRTPSYTGLLTEIFRRMDDTRRSLHPTKSVAAWGALRDDLISEHHEDIRPYSIKSPYFKFIENNGKAIGIGVAANYMSFVHTIDDYLGNDFPVDVYHSEVLEGKLIDYEGNERIVQTLAHNLVKIRHDIVRFIKRYLAKEQGNSFTYKRRNFYYVDAKTFFDIGVKLAREGTTIYKRNVYKKEWRKSNGHCNSYR